MRTLIYKRIHKGDPDIEGRFGVKDCMGRVREWDFEAVIGVGGIGAEPKSYGIDRKVNWIGIGPHKREEKMQDEDGKTGLIVIFDHFLLFESDGPSFPELAPRLADRMYLKNVRMVMDSLDQVEQKEVAKILALAKDAPPSSDCGGGRLASLKKCAPRDHSSRVVKGCSR